MSFYILCISKMKAHAVLFVSPLQQVKKPVEKDVWQNSLFTLFPFPWRIIMHGNLCEERERGKHGTRHVTVGVLNLAKVNSLSEDSIDSNPHTFSTHAPWGQPVSVVVSKVSIALDRRLYSPGLSMYRVSGTVVPANNHSFALFFVNDQVVFCPNWSTPCTYVHRNGTLVM